MPKIEYSIDYSHIADIKAEIEVLKVERMNAFIDNDQTKVDYYTSRMAELTSELESLNVVEH